MTAMVNDLVWVYLLERDDARLYVGLTRNVAVRVRQHQSGHGSRFTRGRSVRLVGALPVGTRVEAGQLERRIKRWSPERKRRLFAQQVYLPPRVDRQTLKDFKAALDLADMQTEVLCQAFATVGELAHRCAPAMTNFLRLAGLPTDTIGQWFAASKPEQPMTPGRAIVEGLSDALLASVVRAHFEISAPCPPSS